MIHNLSAQNENNLRRVSEVGVATFNAVVSASGSRLDASDTLAIAADDYQVYCIPADSIVTKIFFIVDEAFDAAVTAAVTTIVDGTSLVALLDLATEGPTAGVLALDTYFDAADGINIKLSADVTVGSFRTVIEYISGSTNNGIYVDSGV